MWIRLAKYFNGSEFYKYILLYIDDTLVISKNAKNILRNGISKYFKLKKELMGLLKIYLGGHTYKVQLENKVKA